MAYRAEIDGLRALAVLSVLAFHAGVDGAGGGFVGVDVFFVISGYVITNVIRADLAAGSFSLLGFCENRVRRLAPPLLAVLLVTLPVAAFCATPAEMKSLAQATVAAAGMLANVYYFKLYHYFAPSAQVSPLLHTWSLAVEAQFYVAYPILLLVCRRWSKRALLALLGALAVASVASAHGVSTAASFYLLPWRAWELLAGALLAVAAPSWHRTPSPAAEAGAAAGLAMIVGAVLAFSDSGRSSGVQGLVPILGAVLVIGCAGPATVTGRILAWPPLVAVGLASYSLYLWHQPVYALARLRTLEPLSAVDMALLTGLVFALAYASWRFVERPFRRGRAFSRRAVLGGWVVVSGALILVGYAGHVTRGFTGPLEADLRPPRFQWGRLVDSGHCFLNAPHMASHPPECLDARRPLVVVWGDSHAASLYPGLRAGGTQDGYTVSQVTAAGCPPLFGVPESYLMQCGAVNAAVVERLKVIAPDVLILAAAWRHWHYRMSDGALSAVAARSFAAIARALPGTRILVVGPGPRWPRAAHDMALHHHRREGAIPTRSGMAIRLDAVDRILRDAAQAQGFAFASLLDALCDGSGCALTADGRMASLLYIDYGHLSAAGAAVVYTRVLRPYLASVLALPQVEASRANAVMP